MPPSNLPTSPPPPSIHEKALRHLISRLDNLSISSSSAELIDYLTSIFHIEASLQLSGNLIATQVQVQNSYPYKPSTKPLKTFLTLLRNGFNSNQNTTSSSTISLPLLLDIILAYPHHLKSVQEICEIIFRNQPKLLTDIRDVLVPSLASRLWDVKQKSIRETAGVLSLLLSLTRAYDEIKRLMGQKKDIIVPALDMAYSYLSTAGDQGIIQLRAKSDILLVLHNLLAGTEMSEVERESALRSLGDGSGTEVILHGHLREDYESIFRGVKGRRYTADDIEILSRIQQVESSFDPRLKPFKNLFPTLPLTLIQQALRHPKYSASSSHQSPDESVAPLIDAILSGGGDLPDELAELRIAVKDLGDHLISNDNRSSGPPSAPGSSNRQRDVDHPVSNGVSDRPKAERRNIWSNEELDLSRLRLGKDESSLPQIASSIPDHLRASILRLVETQAEEEEAQRRALLEAHGSSSSHGMDHSRLPSGSGASTSKKRRPAAGLHTGLLVGDGETDDDELPPRVKILGEGEESDPEKDSDMSDLESERSSSPPPGLNQRPDAAQLENQAKLELTYLANKNVFNRDGETRRSKARQQLREATGMDDSQLEGWKVMLERNPHEEAILSRHQWNGNGNGNSNHASGERKDGNNRGGRGGGGRGDSSLGGGRGGGSGSGRGGGASGSGEGGRGRGRGRGGSKGSRGHSNAARTRGHDKKMSKMGAGL